MTRVLPFLLAAPLLGQPLDLAINNGRVLDPATNLDAVRHIGVRAGKIAEISTAPLTARRIIDAAGLTVTP
ncbi:MAG TPA: D-glutamate deacylase, partial [Verrucomicrobiae bacterium]|nr:D-glutamate deacylase [Verrucomicrobiae bacterium]